MSWWGWVGLIMFIPLTAFLMASVFVIMGDIGTLSEKYPISVTATIIIVGLIGYTLWWSAWQ